MNHITNFSHLSLSMQRKVLEFVKNNPVSAEEKQRRSLEAIHALIMNIAKGPKKESN